MIRLDDSIPRDMRIRVVQFIQNQAIRALDGKTPSSVVGFTPEQRAVELERERLSRNYNWKARGYK